MGKTPVELARSISGRPKIGAGEDVVVFEGVLALAGNVNNECPLAPLPVPPRATTVPLAPEFPAVEGIGNMNGEAGPWNPGLEKDRSIGLTGSTLFLRRYLGRASFSEGIGELFRLNTASS